MKSLTFKSSPSLQNRQKEVSRPLFDILQLKNLPPLNEDELRNSIAQEIRLILNTRPTYERNADKNNFENKAIENVENLLPTHFGLGDFALQQANSLTGRGLLIQEIKKTIERFEPRLKNLHIQLSFSAQHKLSASLEISGDMEWNQFKKRTTFPVVIENLFVDKSGNGS